MTLSNGDVLIADILIGADGYKSIVRDVVLGEEDCAKPGGMTLYTGVIKAEDMLQDPELRPYALADEVRSQHGLLTFAITEPSQWPIFMGAHRSVCGELSWKYPVCSRS